MSDESGSSDLDKIKNGTGAENVPKQSRTEDNLVEEFKKQLIASFAEIDTAKKKRTYRKNEAVWTEEYKKERAEKLAASRAKAIEKSKQTRAANKAKREIEKARAILESQGYKISSSEEPVEQVKEQMKPKKIPETPEPQKQNVKAPAKVNQQVAPKSAPKSEPKSAPKSAPKSKPMVLTKKDEADEAARKKKELLKIMKRVGFI